MSDEELIRKAEQVAAELRMATNDNTARVCEYTFVMMRAVDYIHRLTACIGGEEMVDGSA